MRNHRVGRIGFLLAVLACGSLLAQTATTLPPDMAAELGRVIELERQGKIQEAERLTLKVIRAAEVAGDDSIQLALGLNSLGALYYSTLRYPEAERKFQRALRILESLEGEMAQRARARVQLNLVCLYVHTGRAAKVRKLDLPSLLRVLRTPDEKAKAKSMIAGLAALRRTRRPQSGSIRRHCRSGGNRHEQPRAASRSR